MKLVIDFPNNLKSSQKVFSVFLVTAGVFLVGSFFDFENVQMVSTLLLIPLLVLYYRYKSKNWFVLAVFALLLFYIHDILPYMGVGFFTGPSHVVFFGGTTIMYLFALTGFQKANIHFVEWISLFIMYGFLAFVFYSIYGLIPQVMVSSENLMYIRLFLLTFLLALTFTRYLVKSHYASLWMMLSSASLLISELSLFFKSYVVDDFSVRLFYPLFHVFAYYALIEHVIHRRRSERHPFV